MTDKYYRVTFDTKKGVDKSWAIDIPAQNSKQAKQTADKMWQRNIHKFHISAKQINNKEIMYNDFTEINEEPEIGTAKQNSEYKLSDMVLDNMPDDITIKARNEYGYISDELLPISKEKALSFFDDDLFTIYRLYEDNTEGEVDNRDEIENFGGMFGIETIDWEKYLNNLVERNNKPKVLGVKTIETTLYSEPDENHRVKKLGNANVTDVFTQLNTHLEENGLMPNEYFILSSDLRDVKELPDFYYFNCNVNFGGSEGIYLDIGLVTQDGIINFATGKTLDDSYESFIEMGRIAAECSLMLNGDGMIMHHKNIDDKSLDTIQEQKEDSDMTKNETLKNNDERPLETTAFGNTPYRYVPNKTDVIIMAENAEAVSAKLKEAKIRHSGQITENGEAKITYDGSKQAEVDAILSLTKENNKQEQTFSVPENDLKAILFQTVNNEYEKTVAVGQRDVSETESKAQRDIFKALYDIIIAAGLEDEYQTWKEQNAKEAEVKEEQKEQAKNNKAKAKAEIFGNTPYYKIENKGYLKVASDVTKTLMSNLDAAGISYSGKINNNGTATITFNIDDHDSVYAALDKAKEQTQENSHNAKAEIFGNTPYFKIENKAYMNVPVEILEYMKKNIDKAGILYSGRINNNGTATITCSKENYAEVKDIVSEHKPTTIDKNAEISADRNYSKSKHDISL